MAWQEVGGPNNYFKDSLRILVIFGPGCPNILGVQISRDSPQRYRGHASLDVLLPQTRHSDSQGFGDRPTEINLLKDGSWKPTTSVLPSSLRRDSHSNGNSISMTIRESCPPKCQDLVCPDPSLAEHATPPPKRRR